MYGMLATLQASQTDGLGQWNLARLMADPGPLLRAALLIFVGMPVAWAVSRWVRSYVGRLYTPHKGLIVGKVVFWPIALILAVSVLNEVGFSLAPLLGAAGILGVALGFASQTSVSNIISGFFLLAEEPFMVGDVINVGDVTGAVLSIDMLSVKLRTFDNKMVRIPNETLVKAQFTNVTRFPIRRVDVPVGVAYKEDIGRVRAVLLDVAEANPNVLMEPAPVVMFSGYGASSIDFTFAVWAKRESWLAVKNSITEEVKRRLDSEGIEIPFPHVSLYTGSVTEPFPIRIEGGPPPAAEGDG
ncbi:MAG TPA: mechanosensitive ion channel family protein [Longimicrobiales bacterium]|nr:mechanosensitive ion channel family protein [Longimicrobiales bacterium]